MNPIYLDYNATTPMDPAVIAAMRPYLESKFGNPSSSHKFGVETRTAVVEARARLAKLLNCQPDEVVFTSGGSESNNYAIKGIAFARREMGNHIITTQIEHPAVSEVCRYLGQNGFEVTYLPVDEQGLISKQDVLAALRPTTILVTVMHANNEVGSLQPIAEIGQEMRQRGIVFHTDAAQSIGKVPVDVQELQVDLLSVAGHKLYAPKGIGALYIRRGIQLEKLIHGANHERNYRAGTENVLEIVGLGKAAELAAVKPEEHIRHLREMRDRLHQGLEQQLGGEINLKLNGHPTRRLPNTLSISFAGIEANTLLAEIEEQVAASAGAACHSDNIDVSVTLAAMHVPVRFAMGTLRLSTGRFTSSAEIDRAVQVISTAARRLKPDGQAQLPVEPDNTEIKLTHFTHGLGCACKLRPQALEKILHTLPAGTDANVLIGLDNSDDAAVYRLNEQQAIVQTVDFFTPIVDDPYDFGAIAAANSLSDIYAMGARPLFALNIVGFPSNRLPMTVLEQILKGASDKAREAGIDIIGGHTVDDSEPKFGMAVTGLVATDTVWSNATMQAGDRLILTKPIGTGILTTALKRGMLDDQRRQLLTRTMAQLNRRAAEVATGFAIHAATDVTGFGLLGHLKEMSTGAKMNVRLFAGTVPLLDGALELAESGVIPGGTENNQLWLTPFLDWDDALSPAMRALLCDAQTSGGLLFAVAASDSENLQARLQAAEIPAVEIGVCTGTGTGVIRVEAGND
jgi:cysteine desulfurase